MRIARHPSQARPDAQTPAQARRAAEIRDWLIAAVADRTRSSRTEIRADEPMHRYGIDSLERVNIAYELECWMGLEVDESTLANLETIDEVAAHLATLESTGER